MYSSNQWGYQKDVKNTINSNPNWMEIFGRDNSFDFIIILSLQTINTQKKIPFDDNSSFLKNMKEMGANKRGKEKKNVILELNEIVCFPFIVLKNESREVQVYDQLQIYVSPTFSSTSTNFSYAPNLMQCIRSVKKN